MPSLIIATLKNSIGYWIQDFSFHTKKLLNHHVNIMLMIVIQFKNNHHAKYFA